MTIDKLIPIPKVGSGRKFKYPFLKMMVGDSFWVATYASQVMASANRVKDMKFTSRQEVRDNVRGTRVWRIS